MSFKPEETQILATVQSDARLSIRELATRCDLPETTTRDILHRLERNGVIKGYRVKVNPTAIGATVRNWIIARVPDDDGATLRSLLADPCVERAHHVPDRPGCIAIWMNAPTGNDLAVKLARWAVQFDLRIEESHNLCEVTEQGRDDVRDEAPDAWFTILKDHTS